MTTRLVFKATFTPTAANSDSSEGLKANGFTYVELAPNQFFIEDGGAFTDIERILGPGIMVAVAVELNKKAVRGTYEVTRLSPEEKITGERMMFQLNTHRP